LAVIALRSAGVPGQASESNEQGWTYDLSLLLTLQRQGHPIELFIGKKGKRDVGFRTHNLDVLIMRIIFGIRR